MARRARGVAEVRRRRERAPSVPTLDSAAFLGSPRDRSVSWEDLRGRQPGVPPPFPTPTAPPGRRAHARRGAGGAPECAGAPPEMVSDAQRGDRIGT